MHPEAYFFEPTKYKVTFGAEMSLQRRRLCGVSDRIKKWNRRKLQRVVGTTFEKRARRLHRRDDGFGAYDPTDTPAREAEVLGKAVDDDDGVGVDV
ncbi:hypothetical protein BC938DRAFT_479525 [Jimgerdemannia flammicorona]|uniref:Uncharacterized protein n=1 Tax=Jimgerdemannia flammicorona TaxID=994334 RepID=A0A433QXR5_9FUNG|nr:hypothetical protein BC938DRAFT_479525 [Jimgerdemannia flammicorona]